MLQCLPRARQGQHLASAIFFEASITPLPGNVNALALRHNESLVTLTANNQNDIIPNFKTPDMKAIALKLGLAETATENEILAAIGKVMLKASNADSLQRSLKLLLLNLPVKMIKRCLLNSQRATLKWQVSFLHLKTCCCERSNRRR